MVRRWFGLIMVVLMVPACTAAAGTRPAGTARIIGSGSTPGTSPLVTPPPSPGGTAPWNLPPRFQGAISRIPPALAQTMRGTTWHAGCPVPMSNLRLLTLRYWGFDGVVDDGPIVVNASVARDVLSVFRALFRARFVINEVHLALQYIPGHQDPTDRRDYTASFNCRPVVTARGPKNIWSPHAF